MTLGGLMVTAKPSVPVTALVLWALLTLIAVALLNLSIGQAIFVALVAVVLHWLSILWHHLGHAITARSTGYPMVGIRLWGGLATSAYPADEPLLPAAIHIRRALGGPIASAVLTLIAGVGVLLLPINGVARWISLFAFADNLLVFTLQAFVPLGFNDGATLWRWAPRLFRRS